MDTKKQIYIYIYIYMKIIYKQDFNVLDKMHHQKGWLVGWLVRFYAISTILYK